jgi:hypothetical protein
MTRHALRIAARAYVPLIALVLRGRMTPQLEATLANI